MTSLILAAAFFTGIHLFVAGTALRDRLVGLLGERGYLGAFSLASACGLAWLGFAFAGAPFIALFEPFGGSRGVALGLSVAAFFLVVCGLSTPNPASQGPVQDLLARGDAVRGILRITRHPFLWGVAIWALAHLQANGDAASLVLFGSLGGLALAGTRSIDQKRARRYGASWAAFTRVSSNLPFGALDGAGASRALAEIGIWRLLASAAAWLAVLAVHARAFGVSPFPA